MQTGMREMEARIEQSSQRVSVLNIERVGDDLKQILAENAALQAQLQ